MAKRPRRNHTPVFKALAAVEASLQRREGDPLQVELDQAMRKIGELAMGSELLRKRCEAK